MPVHKGFRVFKRKYGQTVSFTVQVWGIKENRYALSKSFSSKRYGDSKIAESEARLWGREEAAKQLTVSQTEYSTGHVVVDTQKMLDAYFKRRDSLELNAKHNEDIRNVLANLPQHCPNLADSKAGACIYAWWLAWSSTPTPGGKQKAARTKNRGIGHVKAFATWCHKARQLTNLEHAIDLGLLEKISEEKTVKAQFTVEEMRKGFSVTTMPRSGVLRPHSYVILWAIYIYLGLRAREGLNLRWDHFEGGHVFVSGKGKKERLVPMQAELAPHLERHRKKNDHDGFLFPKHMRECDSSDPAKRLNSFLKKAGIERKGRTTHSLRHCYAGMMTATGEPTALLQAYMGHSQSDMTMHYAQMAARYRQDVEGWERGKIQLDTQYIVGL